MYGTICAFVNCRPWTKVSTVSPELMCSAELSIKVKGADYSLLLYKYSADFTINPQSKSSVYIWRTRQPRHISLTGTHLYLGGEEQTWDKFLAQENYSGQGGIRTWDLSIPTPASYH
ncbi:hypothetical protein DPMN_042647 [Dreissena polymorpha]|uniref:Uncharacterized protein n=1 Tax=Dreissena polymorpha TaxID=45954 RepID=A0A9D4HX57_DREPO|nr:hypothetical protein DPMN_042647 [Dreissena polymorpha]